MSLHRVNYGLGAKRVTGKSCNSMSVIDRVLSPSYFPSPKQAVADYHLVCGMARNLGIELSENRYTKPVRLERLHVPHDSYDRHYIPDLVLSIQEAMQTRDVFEKRRRVYLALKKVSVLSCDIKRIQEREKRRRMVLEHSHSRGGLVSLASTGSGNGW